MSIKKVTLASLILLGLTACSSGGSGGSSSNVAKPNTKPQTTQQQTDKAAAEKAAKEKAEAERLAAEKAAKEKAEAERLAAEKAEKAEEDRLNNRIAALKQGAVASGVSEDLVLQIQSMVANPPLNDELLDAYEKALNNAKILTETGKALTVNTSFHQDKIATESLNDLVHSSSSAEKFFLDTFKGFDGDLYTTGLNRGEFEKSAKTTFHSDYVFQRVEGSRDDIYNQKSIAILPIFTLVKIKSCFLP